MADSNKKGPGRSAFSDDEKTVRLDLSALKQGEDPLFNVDEVLSDNADLTFTAADEEAKEIDDKGLDLNRLNRELDSLSKDVDRGFDDLVMAGKPEHTDRQHEETVVLNRAQGMALDTDDGLNEFLPDETVSLTEPEAEPAMEMDADAFLAEPFAVDEEAPAESEVVEKIDITLVEEPEAPETAAGQKREPVLDELSTGEMPAMGMEKEPDEIEVEGFEGADMTAAWEAFELRHHEPAQAAEQPAAKAAEQPAATKRAEQPRPAQPPRKEPKAAAPAEPEPTPEPAPEAAPPAYVAEQGPRRGSGTFGALLGLIGIAAGGAGVWMAMEANDRTAALEQEISVLRNTFMQSGKTAQIATLESRVAELEAKLGSGAQPAAAPVPEEEEEEAVVETPAKPVATITPAPPATPKPAPAPWVVYLASHPTLAQAQSTAEQFKALGIDTEIRSADIKGRTWHRVVVTGFASRKAASDYLQELRRNNNVEGAWVGKE